MHEIFNMLLAVFDRAAIKVAEATADAEAGSDEAAAAIAQASADTVNDWR